MVVVDSSAVVDYLLAHEGKAEWVEAQLDAAAWDLHAPHLIDIEVVGVLRRLTRQNELDATVGPAAIQLLERFRLVRYPHAPLLEGIWELRHNLSASDAAYAALAEILDASLVTTDARLSRAPGLRIEVIAP